FKLLLAANNRALEVMADMEEALRGARPFGMNYVRAQCTRVSSNVFQIAKGLNDICNGRYEALYARFKDIQLKINPHVSAKRSAKSGPLVLPLSEVDAAMAGEVGGKVANLGEICKHLGLRIPSGFAVTASGYQRFMDFNELQPEIDRRIQATDARRLDEVHAQSSDIQQLIIRSALPEDLEQAIVEHYRRLESEAGARVRVAMRSSALGEDLLDTSFAGQYRSELNVGGGDLLQTYKEIVASKYGVTAMTYRLNRGIPDEDVAMCVGCMVMVEAASGGVMYSRNPMNIRDDAVIINAMTGLPKSIVDGSVNPDIFEVPRALPMAVRGRRIALKDYKYVCDPQEGVRRVAVTGDEANESSLSEEKVLELAGLAVRIEDYYGAPQDIEWAVDAGGRVTIIQARPLKQIETLGPEAPAPAAGGSALLSGGITASPGVAAGEVFVVRKDMDTLRFPDGAVLVAAQSQPRWATLLNRASAVVTEMGSAVGHLANVAREFGVPAIFGAAGAVRILEGAGLVTVDATGRAVHRGEMPELLARREKPKNLMAGSPVHEALKAASEHIIPLTLLDPDSSGFRPEKCRTFHDITRFCHEKSVREMFQMGSKNAFLEHSSKQLVCEVPMQYWVIDLEDGFKERVEGRTVHLDNIASRPMLAIWRGMVAAPWSGPPPVDARGFMSVLAGAAANPDLEASMGSAFSVRNYFMISKTFCSLQSRFGFHFSTAEAVAGEDPAENYISFQFKGGAASLDRRLLRARLVGGILEDFDFRAEIKEDAVFARLEGYPRDFVEQRLEVLGYLIIHTRQLDMVMSGPAAAAEHRAKIMADLDKLGRGKA
ncbi:MAG: PEP/pyruvate-binding domain-containing protein, partial [Desulfovibrionaceae bacterium]|nr:PEP/pyruvate-binding domain-containing protein [Desulfovibrionaceae bacterium]